MHYIPLGANGQTVMAVNFRMTPITTLSNNSFSFFQGQNFFTSYQIKSQKDRCAILISPHDLPGFIQDLKILGELNYDAQFKLTQCQTDDQVQKFIEITGYSSQSKERETVRSFVQIDAHFDKQLFPEEIESKNIEFGIDSSTC